MINNKTKHAVLVIGSGSFGHRASFLSAMSFHSPGIEFREIGISFQTHKMPDLNELLLHYHSPALPCPVPFVKKEPEFQNNHFDLTKLIKNTPSVFPQMTQMFHREEPFSIVTIKNTFPRIPQRANMENKNG